MKRDAKKDGDIVAARKNYDDQVKQTVIAAGRHRDAERKIQALEKQKRPYVSITADAVCCFALYVLIGLVAWFLYQRFT